MYFESRKIVDWHFSGSFLLVYQILIFWTKYFWHCKYVNQGKLLIDIFWIFPSCILNIKYFLGERNDECEKYKDIPKCFKPCPARCEQSFKVCACFLIIPTSHVHLSPRTRRQTRAARGLRPPPSCPSATSPPKDAPGSVWTRPPIKSALARLWSCWLKYNSTI